MKRLLLSGVAFAFVFSAISSGLGVTDYTLEEAIKNGDGIYLLKDAGISIKAVPSTVDEFIKLRDSIARNPMGGYAVFVAAMIRYGQDKDLGLRFFTIAMDKSNLEQTNESIGYKGYKPNRQAMYLISKMDEAPYLGNIYITGTGDENGYRLPNPPYVIKFRQATIEGNDYITMFAFTTSGNTARPISLKKNDKGIWKAYGFSSVFIGVSRLPKKVEADDL